MRKRVIADNDSDTYGYALVRKYNCVYYNCTAVFANTAKDRAIPAYRHNSVPFFRGPPAKLYVQLCFRDPEHLIDLAVYDRMLALGFARPDHGKVILLD